MKCYLDITLLPDAEANLGFLWQKVFQQAHIALVENGYEYARKENDGSETTLRGSNIAVSFPCYGDKTYLLGNKLRLLAQEQAFLEGLGIEKWLSRLQDYVQIASIKAVPSSVSYAGFRQKRVKGEKRLEQSLQKKAKHLSDKFSLDFNSALQELKKKHAFNEEKLPYIQVESQSNSTDDRKPRFKLFIEKAELVEPQQGKFDCYGLSKTATVPWFD
jgi:CRISPR-associated endonuclease Csy4